MSQSKKLEELQQLYANEIFKQIADGIETEAHNIINELKNKIDVEYNAITNDKPLLINIGNVEKPKKKIVHSAFTDIIKVLQSQKAVRKNIMLVGEAGSGKTQLASDVAEAMNLQFYPMSVGLQTTKSDLLGFINAYGNYITTPLREAFEKGGVLLLDEFDATHAGVVTIINSLLANGHCSFPDKVVTAHPQFVCIVACNTYGDGGTFNYIGRNKLDAATLDRFITIKVGYDNKLEAKLTDNPILREKFNRMRELCNSKKLNVVLSTRALLNCQDLMHAGYDMKDALQMCVFKGLDEDTKIMLMEA